MKNSHGNLKKILDDILLNEGGIPRWLNSESHRCLRCGKAYYTVHTICPRTKDELCPECKQATCKKALKTGKKVMKKIAVVVKKRKR